MAHASPKRIWKSEEKCRSEGRGKRTGVFNHDQYRSWDILKMWKSSVNIENDVSEPLNYGMSIYKMGRARFEWLYTCSLV
ncbi:MAG: hypothetical protein AB7U40_07700 [Methanobacteriales archaeon]